MTTSSTPAAADPTPTLDVPPERRPRHIAIIMDGNGRWAQERGLPRGAGHSAGAKAVRSIVTESARLGVEALTLYSFSLENWKRPADEVNGLMDLYLEYLAKERETMIENNIRFRQLGRREGLPSSVLHAMDQVAAATAHCDGMTLALALNYGSRAEIVDAVRVLAAKVASGGLAPGDITESMISDELYTAGLPDPDLLIRTAGERRISNYLLWQISYAEIHVAETYWPDYRAEHLHEAIRDFASRDRRFGGLSEAKR